MLAIYTRLSREDLESSSIDNQIREGKQFAKDNGFKAYKIYNEGQGVSGGADIKDRPQLFKLLQDIANKEIESVWFRNQNRLERNSTTFHIFITQSKKYKVDVYFNDKLFDYDNPQDNLFGTITSALNQYSKDLQSVQTKRTLRDNIKEGKVWSIIAYGYKSENGYLAIDEVESKIVKEIYDLSLSGIGTRAIANMLNDKGIVSRKKTKFRPNTIRSIIKNTIYKGERIYSNVVFESPIIIDSEYWQKVNDNLKNNVTNSGKKVEYKYLLKGLLKCSKCGRNYYGRKRANKKDNFYMCSSKRFSDLNCGARSINIDILDKLIWHTVIKQGTLKKHITEEHSKLSKKSDNYDLIAKRDKKSKEINDINKKIENTLEIIVDSEVLNSDTKTIFNKKVYSLQKTKKALKSDLNAINKELEVFDEMSNDIDSTLSGFDAYKDYKKLTHKVKREIIIDTVESITITDYKDLKHYIITIYPKIGFRVRPLLLFMNYSKDYVMILSTSMNSGMFNLTNKSLDSLSTSKRQHLEELKEEVREGFIEIFPNYKRA